MSGKIKNENEEMPGIQGKSDEETEITNNEIETKKAKRTINISEDEREKRRERMIKLREKLDNINNNVKKPPVEPSKKQKQPTRIKEKTIQKKQLHNTEESDNSDSDYEPIHPTPPKKIIDKNETKSKVKQMPRKVLKIKYYHEPSHAEMLQDRLFLENQHKADHEYQQQKNHKERPQKNNDDLSDKLFNY